ncbi:RING finger domain protein [Catovirus CTV1]|uniref:RING finger domain protein n=1 Tax=Catovirus CTV1 TaxID=1977631 RepID=A0A1V0SA91_9VIRU|nr:RING finger domain protein [Catovirus CTV1]
MTDINTLIKDYDSDILLKNIIDNKINIDLVDVTINDITIKRVFVDKNISLLSILFDKMEVSKENYKNILKFVEKQSVFHNITNIILFNLGNKYKPHNIKYFVYHKRAYEEFNNLESGYNLFKYYQKMGIKNDIYDDIIKNYSNDDFKYVFLLEKIVENYHSLLTDDLYNTCRKYINLEADPSLIVCYKSMEYLLNKNSLNESFDLLFEICKKFGYTEGTFVLYDCLEFIVSKKQFPYILILYLKYDNSDYNSDDLWQLFIKNKILTDDKFIIKQLTNFTIEDNEYKKHICKKILHLNESLKTCLYLLSVGYQEPMVIDKICQYKDIFNAHCKFITNFDLFVYNLNQKTFQVTDDHINDNLLTNIIDLECPICLSETKSIELNCCNANICKECLLKSMSIKTICPFCNQTIKIKQNNNSNINFFIGYDNFMKEPLHIQIIL